MGTGSGDNNRGSSELRVRWLVQFFRELKLRGVVRMTAFYVIGSWVVLQVADLLFPALGVQDAAIRFVWLAVVLGFPLAVFFSWRYDVTARGITRTVRGDITGVDAALRKTDYVVLLILLFIAVFTVSSMTGRVLQEQAALDIAPETRAIQSNTVAVLPLEDLSSDPDQAYFASGMYDTLISSLCKVTALRVTSRTSASRLDTNLTVPMIGRRLGVAYVIEGSVTREANQVRITVQLIDAAADQHVWAETYERDFVDVISVQADVARAVARAIQVKLSEQDEIGLSRSLQIRPQTFEAYLRAMFQFRKESRRAYRRGIEILETALENDPTNGLAYAGLAQGYAELGHSPYPVQGAYKRAKAAADKALELDDMLAEAHLAAGMYKSYYEYDWEGAEREYRRAIELNPSLADAWYHLAWLLELLGRDEEAIAAGERTVELSPLSSFYTSWLASQYRDAGQFEHAIDLAESVLEVSPEYPVAWMVLGNAYAETGRFDQAIAAHEEIADSAFWSWTLATTYARAGQAGRARAIAESIEPKDDNAFPLVLIYSALGDKEEALHWMQRAYEIRIPWYPWLLAWFPSSRFLYDDPDIRAKAREIGLTLPRS